MPIHRHTHTQGYQFPLIWLNGLGDCVILLTCHWLSTYGSRRSQYGVQVDQTRSLEPKHKHPRSHCHAQRTYKLSPSFLSAWPQSLFFTSDLYLGNKRSSVSESIVTNVGCCINMVILLCVRKRQTLEHSGATADKCTPFLYCILTSGFPILLWKG